jgi:hypothetical protein
LFFPKSFLNYVDVKNWCINFKYIKYIW